MPIFRHLDQTLWLANEHPTVIHLDVESVTSRSIHAQILAPTSKSV